MKAQGTKEGLIFDIRVKILASCVCVGFMLGIYLIHKDNASNLLAGFSLFGLLLFIFLLGLKSDYKALRWYENYIKEQKIKPVNNKHFSNRKRLTLGNLYASEDGYNAIGFNFKDLKARFEKNKKGTQ